MATEVVQIILDAKNKASKELKDVQTQLRGMDKAAKMVVGGFAALGGAAAAMQLGRFAMEMTQLNTQMERSAFAFEHFSGGAAQAEANLRAVQRASGGTLTTFEAQNLAVTAMTQGLAKTSGELERVTKVARGIVAVSPIINDLETAFSQLGLTIANQSMLRLDQLGTSAGEIKPKIEELKSANKNLTDEMAFQIALMDTLESKYDPLLDAAVNSASGMERLTNAIREQRAEIAKHFGWLDGLAGDFADILGYSQKTSEALALMSNPPADATPQQMNILGQMAAVVEATSKGTIGAIEARERVHQLLETYYKLGDAALQAGQSEAAAANAAATEQEKQLQAMQKLISDYNTGVEQAGQRAFQTVLRETGNVDVAMMAYEQTISRVKQAMQDLPDNFRTPEKQLLALPAIVDRVSQEISELFNFDIDMSGIGEAASAIASAIDEIAMASARSMYEVSGNADEATEAYARMKGALESFVEAQRAHGLSEREIINLLSTQAGLIQANESWWLRYAEAVDTSTGALQGLAGAMSQVMGMMGAVSGAMSGVAGFASDFLQDLVDMTDGINMSLFGIGADFGQGLEGGRGFTESMLPEVQKNVQLWLKNGATMEEITQVLLPNYLSDLRSSNAELYRTDRALSSSSNNLDNMAVSMGGIDTTLGDIKSTISGIISGAIGPVAGVDANDLLPREDAVNENARRLADIAVNGFKGQDWMSEFALEAPDVFEELKNSSDPKGTAAQILKDFQDGLRPDLLDKERAKELVKRALQGDANTKQLVDEIAADLANELGISMGEAKAKASEVLGTGEGATGVSLAPKIDPASAQAAASSFASAFTTAITDSAIGADMAGAIYTQVTASIALIETSGNEAGTALVRGVTAKFADIPAAFIAAVASLVTPAVQASINSNGGRTGAANI